MHLPSVVVKYDWCSIWWWQQHQQHSTTRRQFEISNNYSICVLFNITYMYVHSRITQNGSAQLSVSFHILRVSKVNLQLHIHCIEVVATVKGVHVLITHTMFSCHHQLNLVNSCFATISQTWLTIACHHQSNTVDHCLPPSVKHGWPLLATISQTRLTIACHHQSNTVDYCFPPSVKHGWLLLATISQTRLTIACHHQSNTVDHFFATISQTRLTIACHHQSNTVDYCLPPSVKHGWLLLCHHQSNTVDHCLPPSVKHGWPFFCHHQSNTVDHYFATISQTRLTIALSPMSRAPCPFVPNALDIKQQQLTAIYIVHFLLHESCSI